MIARTPEPAAVLRNLEMVPSWVYTDPPRLTGADLQRYLLQTACLMWALRRA